MADFRHLHMTSLLINMIFSFRFIVLLYYYYNLSLKATMSFDGVATVVVKGV